MDNFNINEFKEEENLFIAASAGTGKTYTIQQVVARLVLNGLTLDQILIVTYTEKAAGELKDRIRKKINEVLEKKQISKDLPVNDNELSLFKTAYQDVDNAAIFTIHSFCQKALKEYAYDAGRPFDMAMVDDAAVEDLIDRKIRDDWGDDLKELLNGDKNTSSLLENIKKQLINAVNLYKGKDAKGDYIIDLSELKCFDDLMKLPGFEAKVKIFKDSAEPKSEGFVKGLKDWTAGTELFSGAKYKASYFRTIAERDFNYFKDLKGLLKKSDEKLVLNHFLYSHTESLFEEWQKLKAENKLQSFNDMILSVHQAVLSSDNSLKTRLRAQYQYAIIDEFQDTNQLQWDIFRSVFLKDGEDRVPNHSIYVVGDPKQSYPLSRSVLSATSPCATPMPRSTTIFGTALPRNHSKPPRHSSKACKLWRL